MTAEKQSRISLTGDERNRLIEASISGRTNRLWSVAEGLIAERLAPINALADEWIAKGTVSVYESAAELGELIKQCLRGAK